MPNKEIFVLKLVWKKSIASLHRLTQAVQRANLRRTAGDPTWVPTMQSDMNNENQNEFFFFSFKLYDVWSTWFI